MESRQFTKMMLPNNSRGSVKTHGDKSGNDPFCDMGNLDEMSSQTRWSKHGFSHNLSPDPTAVGAGCSVGMVHDVQCF